MGFVALHSLAIGLLVCDGAGRVIFPNASAEGLARAKAGIAFGRADRGVTANQRDLVRLLSAIPPLHKTPK